MSIFPSFQTSEDDDPRLDTSGRKEEVDVADLPDEVPPKEAPEPEQKPAPEAQDAAPAVSETPADSPVDEGDTAIPEKNVEPAEEPEQVAAQNTPPTAVATTPAEAPAAEAPASEAPAAEAEAAVPAEAPTPPERSAETAPNETATPVLAVAGIGALAPFVRPDSAPIFQTYAQRRASEVDGGNVTNVVTQITDEEAFKKEAEKHLGIHQGDPEGEHPGWMNKPTIWPKFIKFPPRDTEATIRRAEEQGKLSDEVKEQINAGLAELSKLMQDRAAQIDRWILEESEAMLEEERNRMIFFRPHMRKQLEDLNKQRAKNEAHNSKLKNKDDYIPDDPFKDIKWAILLDPTASPQDPMFTNVARWGHNSLETVDGGKLVSTDDGIHVASWNLGTEMAGEMAVKEALNRGWSSIDITGNKAFIEGARKAALEAGLGAKLTTVDGRIGTSRPQYIMPKPPKMPGTRTVEEETKDAHDELMSDEGKAGTSKKPSKALSRPGEAAKGAEEEPAPSGKNEDVDVLQPFDEDPQDEEALRKLREGEATEQDLPTPD